MSAVWAAARPNRCDGALVRGVRCDLSEPSYFLFHLVEKCLHLDRVADRATGVAHNLESAL